MKFVGKKAVIMCVIFACIMSVLGVACSPDTPVEPTEVGYRVEVWLESDSGYELGSDYCSTGKGNVGDTVTIPTPSIAGYVYNSSYEGNVTTLVLSETESDNLFKFYFDKEDIPVAEKILSYNANAESGMTVKGMMEDCEADEDGSVVIAECAFFAEGYRFAGWNSSITAAMSGKVEYMPGERITLERSMTLYAVWNRAYIDRFGGTDEIFLLADGRALLRRGEIEFETDQFLGKDEFEFTLPNGSLLKCKVYSDQSYAYAHEELAGQYSFRSAYYNPEDPDGENAINPLETLILDEYGSGTHTYIDGAGNTVTDKGFASFYNYMSDSNQYEYLFLVTDGANMGSGFVFITKTVRTEGKEIPIFSSTNGEAGVYGSIGQYSAMQLDGYGNLIFEDARYSDTWEGNYWIENIYVADNDSYIFRLNVMIYDDPGRGLTLLRYHVENGVLRMNIYTSPLEDGVGMFFEPHVEAKEYRSEDGATLKLDGFGLFPDSAIYTANGEEIVGSYDADWTPDNNLTITLHESNQYGGVTGKTIVFKIDIHSLPNGGMEILSTFSVLENLRNGTTYVLLDGDKFGTEAIYISHDAGQKGYYAEYGVIDENGYTVLAKGYAEQNTLNVEGLWTFTRTELSDGVDGKEIPESVVFSLAEVYDSNYFVYEIYYVYSVVYEGKEEKHYVDIIDANEEEKHFWYITDTLAYNQYNIGAIYFDDLISHGYEGSLDYSSDSSYFGTVGTFSYTDDFGTMRQMYLSISLGSNGQPAMFEEVSGLEYPVISVFPDGSVDPSAVRLVIRGEDALYAVNGDLENGIYGTVRVVAVNFAGKDIWAFFNSDEIELFRFIMEETVYYEQGYGRMDIVIHYVHDETIDGIYASEECGELQLDGYHWAEYIDADGINYSGTYTLSSDKKIVYFTSRGIDLVFDISGTLEFADGIYGTYAMFADDAWWDVTFDGHGNATASDRRSRREAGIYFKNDDGSVDLFIGIEEGVNSYRLRLSVYEESGEASVFDKNIEGAYVGEDWSVVYLDGFGAGRYYFSDGSGYTRIYYNILDEEIGYLNIIADPSGAEQNLILNEEEKTFEFPKYVERRYVYYGEDLSALIFEPTGDIVVNYTAGYYVLSETVCRAYVLDMELAMRRPVELNGMPGADIYELNGKKFYLYEQGQKVKFTGEVEIDYNTIHEKRAASLEFDLTGSEVITTRATFIVENEHYFVDIVSMYMDYETPQDLYHGLAIADFSQYEYSEVTEYCYNGNGTGTFRIVVTPKTMEMQDGFERENGITSTLKEYRVGFGPISIASRKLSGHVYIGDGKYLDFEDADIETVYNYETDQGNRYNIVFTVEEVTYSMQYNKEDSDYRLYMIGEYRVIEAEEYAVGVINYVYSNGAYSFGFTKGDFADMILYKVDGKNRTAIVAFSKMINSDRTSGWYIDLGSYDPAIGIGKLGSIYTVEFDEKLTEAKVKAYDFDQASQPDNEFTNYYFANLCLENGEVVKIAALSIGGEFGSVVESKELESDDPKEEKWLVTCDGGEKFVVTLYKDDQGAPIRNRDGNWQMKLEVYEEDLLP